MMIDLVASKALKKSGRKKSKTIVLEEKENEIIKQSVKRRKHQNCKSEVPESTTLDENFMLPPEVDIVKEQSTETKPVVDEGNILSDLDDPNNSELLSNVIGCRSQQVAPESGMKCVWSHKKKVRKKNVEMCKCYSELECKTIETLSSAKVLKSKRKFVECFTSFEEKSSDIQCQYPFCRVSEIQASSSGKHSAMTKLVKKSKRHKVCKKTKTSQLSAGTKRPLTEDTLPKTRHSVHFINEVVRLMLENTPVWNTEIVTKLVKTKQLKSGLTKDLILKLLEKRDTPLLQVLVSHSKSVRERQIAEILSIILSDPAYSGPEGVDGKDRQDLDATLSLILSLPFEMGVMKRSLKPVSPTQAKVLLTFLHEKLLHPSSTSLARVTEWCNVLVEVFFSSLLQDTELVRKIYNAINLHIHSCKSLFSLNEHLFRIKHSGKFRK